MIKSVKKFSKKSLAILIALLMIISLMPFTPPISVEAADGGYEVLGNVTLDPIIYTHGAYNGTTNSEYAYMNYGSTIADGSFDGECKTAVSVSETSTKTISSVEAVDVSGASLKGASLKVENGLLKGSLGTTYEGPNKVDTTVTLKFTFSDGTYEYHKMPVKTNPVAQHVAGFAQRWTSGGTFFRGLAVESLAVGSYGQTNSGSYSATTTKTIGASATHNYKKMYEPFNSDKSVGAYCTDKKFYGFIDNAITTDKQNGYAAIANGNNKNNVLTVNSLAAKYYIDLSSSKNYGIVQSNGGYYIDILVGKIYDNFNEDCNVRLDGRSATGLTESSLIGIVNSIDTTVGNGTDRRGYIRYKIDNPTAGSTIEATTYISYRSDNRVYAQVKLNLPINIQITDKSNTRKLYNDYIKDLAPRCYTADSWAPFRDELLKVEEYLNDNTDTSTIDTTALVRAYNGLKPSEDANAHTYGNFTHKYKDGLEYNKDTTYNHTRSCSKCGNNDTQPCKFGNLKKDGNTATLTCSVCGGKYTLALEAYNNAVADAKNSVNNTVAYTSDSINALSSVLSEQATKLNSAKTQDDVDSCTTTIISKNKLTTADSAGVLVLNKYKVTFTYFDTNGQEITKIDDKEYEYGASVDLTVPDEAGQVYKWNKQINSADSKIAGSTNHITHVVTDNVTISAHTVQHQTSDTQYCVTVYNRINKVIGYFYVDKNSKVSIDGPTISVGDNRLTVEKTPFYQISGFKCNGQEISTGFTVTSDVKIYPIYSAQNEIGITLNNNSGNARITFDDGTIETKKVFWDQKVTVQADSEVIWYVDDVAVAKGNKYTFRATESITIKAVADATETGSSIITYANFDSENRKARIAVSSYSSGEKVIKEQGLIILTSTSTSELSYDDIKNNGKKYKATNTTSEGNQFSFTLNVSQSSSIKTFGIISYVIYKDDETTTYYSTECKNIHVIQQGGEI